MDQMKPHLANSSPLTPLGFLERAATVYGDCPSVIFNSTTYTWSQTHRRCLQIASSLSSIGIKRGEVVSVFAPNIPAMYELHFAIPMAGAVLNTVNTRLDSRTVSLLLQHSESKLVFVDYFSVDLVLESLTMFPANLRWPRLVLIDTDEVLPGEKTDFGDVFITSYEQFIEKGNPNFEWIRPNNEWDPMVLNYTSGTTSAPKGVVHCHRGLFIVAFDSLLEWAVPKNPIYLWTLPMFHANGWCYTWGMAAVGGTNICIRKFDGHVVYSLIKQHSVTHMCGAPVVLNMLANTPGQERLLKPVSIMTAGAPPPAAVLFKVEELGFDVCHGYGMTETCGLVLSCAWKPHWNRFPATERAKLKARQGVRTNGMSGVDVLDPETGAYVKHDGVSLGEIVLNGGCITLGYLKDKEATEKSITKDGWFYTGDVGVIHPDGYLEIKDRSKDVIISGGENISSVEVESILYSNPAVNEAAVVARPDEFWGETPCAFVSLKKEFVGKVEEKDIIEHCRSKMSHFMVPKTVVFKDELPKTSTGKLQKYVLRDAAKAMGPGSAKRSRL